MFRTLRNRRGFLLPDPSLIIIIGGIIYTTALGWYIMITQAGAQCTGGFCGYGSGSAF